MRWLGLYLRSRRVPLALAVATTALTLAWSAWLAFSDARTVNARLVSLSLMIAVAGFGATLSGADDTLEHTAALPWPVRRAGHLVLAAAAVVALASLTMATGARFDPAVVLRNTAGLLGLTALGAAVLGAGRSWIAPLAWTLVAVLPMMQPSRDMRMQVAGWLIQPAGTTAATACAAVLAAAGLAAYTRYGCPRQSATQTAPDS